MGSYVAPQLEISPRALQALAYLCATRCSRLRLRRILLVITAALALATAFLELTGGRDPVKKTIPAAAAPLVEEGGTPPGWLPPAAPE